MNGKIIGACVTGLGALFLTHFAYTLIQQRQKRVNKKHAKVAVQTWEGEGGNIIDPAPRAPSN